ncbi:MAG: hypothetical protein GWN79_10665, partial [Actinobacteria bacterium]|nr:hypothetical protein [Actinomycetota bacterium]NIS29634.1 hypothetical protein [Actinomycetota bacterium]NIT95825.1 hypothetical protein [Actinomycetota bacterium]NIU19515.1 hypothetical protein [Actinomycetota bacterium]NIU64957.1 hypothetical protein [Actinomycetota bacterium]
LSRTQELIWASQRLHPATPLANMGDRIRLYGAVDPDRFVAAFDAVVSHAELLRMVVAEGTNTAHVLARPPRTTEVIDLPLGELDDWSATRIATPIDATACVYDSVLIRHADDDWTW